MVSRVALVLASVSCDGPRRPIDAATSPIQQAPVVLEHRDDSCIVGWVWDEPVTLGDARALRMAVQPSPDEAAASRLALDVAVAHAWLHGHVAPSQPRFRLASYREALALAWPKPAVPQFVADLHDATQAARGPCYVEREE